MNVLSCALQALVLVLVLLFSKTHGKNVTLQSSCNYGKPSFPSPNQMSVSTIMPTGTELSYLHCNIWYNSSEGVLQLWLRKTTFDTRGYLISTVLDQNGSLVLPGYVVEARESVSYPFHICPPLGTQDKTRNYSIFLSGPPNTGINLTVQVDESVLHREQTKTLTFSGKVSSRLLVFEVWQIENVHDHFQVTVHSDDTEHECLLIVSDTCSDISDIDPQSINFKDNSGFLRLSFSTFGRIHLTQATKPQLKTGHWFIGVFLKNPKKVKIEKVVHLSVGFAGGVHRISTGRPVVYMVLIAIFGGLAIAVFAEFFLNPQHEGILVQSLRHYVSTYIFAERGCTSDRVDAQGGNVEMGASKQSPTPSICHDVQFDDASGSVISYDMSKLRPPKHWPGLKVWAKVIVGWFNGKGKTFAYITAIMAFSLLTGAAQFIILNWKDMVESGNRDICYYNEGCYRTTHSLDMPNNLIISNIPYIIHGVILAISLSLREAIYEVNETAISAKHLSVPYALAWAFVFQGVFSSFYHICPSRMTFQFDSAFMFVICGLVVVAVFNSTGERRKMDQQIKTLPLQDTKLFLFFVVPLLLLNYLGSMRDTDGLLTFPVSVFYCLTIVWLLSMFSWAVYHLLLPFKVQQGPSFWCKSTWLCVLFPILVVIIGFVTISVKQNWSNFFLYACLISVMCAVCGYSISRCTRNIYKQIIKRRKESPQENGLQWFKHYFKWPLFNFHVVVFTVGVLVCWGFAIYYFQLKPVTDKVKRPSQSRMLNKECVLWDFFDYHDLWHILSSFALLLSAYLIFWCIG